MLYEQITQLMSNAYTLGNVQCLYSKHRRDTYTLSRVQCLYNKNKRNAYTLGNAKCLYGKHRCDALYIKPSAMLIYQA